MKRRLCMDGWIGRQARRDPRLVKVLDDLHARVWFSVIPRRAESSRLPRHDDLPTRRQVSLLSAKEGKAVVADLERHGIQVAAQGPFSLIACGRPLNVMRMLGTDLVVHARWSATADRAIGSFDRALSSAVRIEDLFVAPRESISWRPSPSSIERCVFTPPPLSALSTAPPNVSYYALGPREVRRAYGLAGAQGVNGAGETVAIVDTGCFIAHPAFDRHRSRIECVAGSGALDPTVDFHGHGTAMVGAVLNVAPRARVLAFNHGSVIDGIVWAAKEQGATTILIPRGWENEQRHPSLEAEIAKVVAAGVIVVCSAGNRGIRAWPGSMPQVISVGGVFIDPKGDLVASSFASGYPSNVYPGRETPDVSALCGLEAPACYLALPTSPDSPTDAEFAANDGTRLDDGWIYASGTSAAAAHVAGVVALVNQSARHLRGQRLTPLQMKKLLMASATPVTRGRNAMGVPAADPNRRACGAGFVHARRAIERLRE